MLIIFAGKSNIIDTLLADESPTLVIFNIVMLVELPERPKIKGFYFIKICLGPLTDDSSEMKVIKTGLENLITATKMGVHFERSNVIK